MDNILIHTVPFGLACWWWWVWSLGAILLGWLLNWLLNRGKQTIIDNLTAERDRYHGLATKWEKDYNSVKYQLEESQKGEADLRSALSRCEADKSTLQFKLNAATAEAEAAANVDADKGSLGIADIDGGGLSASASDNTGIAGGLDAGDIAAAGGALGIGNIDAVTDGSLGGYNGLFPNDNLQIIEGVGPKIEEVLQLAGYRTWDELAAAEPAAIKKVLDEAGSRFKLADPTSWPHQAKLAAAGEWDELIRYQKFTDAGRETVGDFQSDSKFEKLAAKKMGFSSTNPNDLKVVEGIGPKIEGLFKAAGINTWSELAETSVERMQEILTAAGDRYRLANPGTWAQQARLAAEGKWDELSRLQDQLKGGK
ncbi:MAG: helix-hairpin-helix domain-containing protein [Bacteroidota bacterium]